MKHSFVLIFCIILQALPVTLLSQQFSTEWSARSETNKVFIENKGQFNNAGPSGKVLFAFDNGSEKIYLTDKGVEYSLTQIQHNNKEKKTEEKFSSSEEWKAKETEEHKTKIKSDVVSFTWEGANTDVQAIAENKATDYFSYSFKNSKGTIENINNIGGYKKIIYKNLYPEIDVEYVFHETDGIKYSLILRPGADISKVKMKYSVVPYLSSNGDLHFKTLFGDIIEHAPVSYSDNKNTVKSEFVLNYDIVSFGLGDNDNSKKIIIDPWVQTPSIPNSNGVWECESDSLGNVYIIGGDMPLKLIKYNSAGNIQWTYSTPWDTSNSWLGTFITDKAGNSYISCGSISGLQKVDSAGTLVWNWVSAPSFYDEYWDMAFNHNQTKLIIGGTSGTSFPINLWGAVFEINISNGSVNSIAHVGSMGTGFMGVPDEVRSITFSPNGRYYYLLHDSLGCINQNFFYCDSNPDIFEINSGLKLEYKCENYRPYNGNAGIKAIKANKHFLYTQNGVIIQQRSLYDGSVLLSDSIPGGLNYFSTFSNKYQAGNSGIDIDSCGNVYVGSGDRVIKYDENLNIISQSAILPYRVYDVKVSSNGNIIVAGTTGNNSNSIRTGYVQSINMTACNSIILTSCIANICPAGPFCSTDSAFSLSAASSGGIWNGKGITDTIAGIFDPSVSGPGIHTIYYTLPCGTDSISVTVNICSDLYTCYDSTGYIHVSNGTPPYTWEYWGTFLNCTNCTSGCSFPPGCAFNDSAWINFGTGDSIMPLDTFPVRVTDFYNNEYIIYDTSSLPVCPNCYYFIITPSGITDVSCTDSTLGSFTASSSGGIFPYDYVLMNGSVVVTTYNNVTGNQYFSNLPPGNYTLYVNDEANCSGDTSIIINDCIISILSPEKHNNISIFPNPNSDILNINLPENEIYQIKVLDINGRKIYETSGKNKKVTINTSGFEKGYYLLNIQTENIPAFNTKLFIK